MLCPFAAGAQVADSVDAIDYDLTLDLSSGNRLCGHAVVTLRMLRECATVGLMLEATTDSVKVDGATVADAALWAVPTAGVAAGDTVRVEVWYRTTGYVEPGGWGGLYLGSSLGYNLGVGFASNPHVIGRALFPCRDNFTDKATYTLRVTTKAGWTAECGGTRLSAEVDSTGCEHSVWRIGQPTPTYLVSVSQAAWQRVQDTVASLYGDYPLTLGYRTGTEADVRSAFAELDSVVPMYERCFGPYRWGRIGYIATPKGSMEHVNNIALQSSFATSLSERAQTTIAHELGHAWFGNLLTCTTDADMWINEGGASFCSEVAMESVLGREASDDYYQRNLEAVLRTTHSTDGAYRALHGLPLHLTYGSTTYDKGWMVWHSLRGYLGEEAFYGAMNRLMASCAFGNIDAEGLRDSLSLYTGVDLEDFFRFHVFSPGFVDYHVEMDTPEDGCLSTSPSLHLHQQSVGTDAHVEFNRVPVTFYARPGYDSTVCKRTILFEGTDAYEMTDLPFVPAFCVLDADCELSDAATVACQQTEGEGTLHTLESEHAIVGTHHATTVCVEHHWGKPMGEMPEGVVRTAQRYWMVRGDWQREAADQGMFRYVRTHSNNTYNGLDRGFIESREAVDSLALLYRRGGTEAWTVVSRQRTGNYDSGFLTAGGGAGTLAPGEYTLAVVDPQAVGIAEAATPFSELFPNPLAPGQALTVEVDTEEPFSLTILDAGGRPVWEKTGCHSGEKMNPALAKGTYFVRIENNFISLQSKLIQL